MIAANGMIYFLHIPKSAGTSLLEVFKANFSAEEIALIYLPPQGMSEQEAIGLPEATKDRIELIYGHFAYGLHKHFGRSGRYVTVLRDTVPRLISTYFHHCRDGLTEGLSLADYLRVKKPNDMDNYTIRLLTATTDPDFLPFGRVDRSHLQRAKSNLAKFDVFGLVEYLTETIDLFRLRLGLPMHPVPLLNLAPDGQNATDIPAADVASVLEHNKLDQELYEFAKSEFSRTLAGV